MKKTAIVVLLTVIVICFAGLASCGIFNGGTIGGSSEDNDGTFIYSGASVKAASTTLSGDIVIPSEHNGTPIDTIPANAFKGCNAVTSITVPDSVISIGAGAFSGCSALRSITLPFVGNQKGTTEEKVSLFGYIFGKESYQGGKDTEQHWSWGVYNYVEYCIPSTLRTVTITNESVIADYAFQNCSMLTKIQLNDEITQVGVQSFENCSKIEEINLPNITIIPSSLFEGCISLKSFTISDSIDTIGSSAFFGCSSLASVNSENTGEFVIPDTVTSIGKSAFNGCALIESITLPFVGTEKGNSGKVSLFGYIFGENSYQGGKGVEQHWSWGVSNYNVYYIPSRLRNVTITNETLIANYAFQNCSMLQSITINKAAQNSVGTQAFENTVTPQWF